MSLPLKAAAAAGVVGGGSLVGCYFGGVFSDTPWVSLKKETGKSYTGKIGESYSIYLLAVHGTDPNNDSNKNFNEAKWKELYKQYLADSAEGSKIQMSNEFKDKKIKSAYDSSTTPSTSSTALNKVCETLYEKTEGTSDDNGIDFSTPDGNNNRDKLAKNLLKYCSPLGKKPSTIGDNKGYPDKSLGVTKKDTLASALDPENYYFWQAQEKWFESETAPQSDLFFKQFFDDGTDGSTKVLNTSMWKICDTAYRKTGANTSTGDQPKISDVEKYCSFKKITTSP